MIRLGIVGSNYGRTVQLPAFRADPRCEVIALAGSNAARTAELARADNIPKAYGDWRALVEDSTVQAVAIATLPSLQAQIAIRALSWASRFLRKNRWQAISAPHAPCSNKRV